MEFDFLAVLKLLIAISGAGIVLMLAGIAYLKHEQKKHRHNAS